MLEELTKEKLMEVLNDPESMRLIEQFKHLRLRRYDLLQEMDYIKGEEASLESEICIKHKLSPVMSLSLMLHIDLEEIKKLGKKN